MDDRTTQDEGDQLFDTDISDGATTPATDTEEEEETSDGEQEQDDLDLDDEEKVISSKAEEQKQKQLTALKRRIEDGELTIDTLPPNLGWLKGDLKKMLDIKKKVEEADIKSMLREEMKAEKESLRFADLQEELNDTLNSEQKAELALAYKRLKSKGLSKMDSLETALEITGIDLNEMGTDVKRSRMRIPSPGKGLASTKSMENTPWGDVAKNYSKEERR